MDICPKMNIIARLEFEHANYDSAVRRFNYYTTKTHHIGVVAIEKGAFGSPSTMIGQLNINLPIPRGE